MKHTINNKLVLAIAMIALFAGCKKDYTDTTSLTTVDFSNKAFVKVFSATTGATRNYVYLPTVTSFTPLVGGAMAYGGTLPGTSTYFSVNEGLNSILIKDTLTATTQTPVFAVGTFEKGKYYSVFTYDTITSVKTKIVADNIEVPTDTTARIRFANFVRSAGTIPNFDIYSTTRSANLYTNITLNDVTPFIPYRSAVSDTVFVRPTGTTTNVAGIVFSASPRRSYTVLFRGRYDTYAPVTPVTTPATTATVPRTLTLFTSY